jgi:hypothetical protein
MIAKAKAIQHGAVAIDYALEKKHAELLERRFVVGDNGTEIKKEFAIFQDLNQRAINNDLSFVISPDPKDGKRLTNTDFKAISELFLKKMGLDTHQGVIVKHTDREHTHLHLFMNRINANGKAFNDSFVSKESQKVADQVAQELGLIRARIIQELHLKNAKALREELFEKHKRTLQQRPKNFKAYSVLMESLGVKIIPSINKSGKMQGFRMASKGNNFKASEVHRSIKLSKILARKEPIAVEEKTDQTIKIKSRKYKR